MTRGLKKAPYAMANASGSGAFPKLAGKPCTNERYGGERLYGKQVYTG
jgi:hypothetical protein